MADELVQRILRDIEATQAEHTRRFDAVDGRFDAIDAQLAEHEDMFRRHGVMLEAHSQNFAQLAAMLDGFSRELREMRRLLVDEHLARESKAPE
jgi:ABC-type transporter Mla subunit MlaD